MPPLRLSRSSQNIGPFLSALGSLRETRLTATLGFLVSRFPVELGSLLGLKFGLSDEIAIEETDGGDRYDVLIRNSGEEHIIEGKVGPYQRVDQLARYIARRRKIGSHKPALTIVDDGSEFSQSKLRGFEKIRKGVKKLHFVTWSQVAKTCQSIALKRKNLARDPLGTMIAKDFAEHLKENNMTTEPYPEIYLRDLSDPSSVELYFRHHIYKCQQSYYKSARNNRYFAPYFTQETSNALRDANMVPVGEGISFISQVASVHVCNKRDVLSFLEERKHPNAKVAADIVVKSAREDELLLLLLGPPRLLFISPVTKRKLRDKVGGYSLGAMGSRSCTLDDLLKASQ
jgi:hypothetical protein